MVWVRLVIQTWSHPRYGWITLPLAVGNLLTLTMVVSAFSPLSYLEQSAGDTLVALALARRVNDRECVLRDISIQGQQVPDLDVRTRATGPPGANGVLGLDFLRQFTDIHFHVPTLVLTLSDQ